MIMMLMIMVVFRLLRAGHGNPRGRPNAPVSTSRRLVVTHTSTVSP